VAGVAWILTGFARMTAPNEDQDRPAAADSSALIDSNQVGLAYAERWSRRLAHAHLQPVGLELPRLSTFLEMLKN
jgi:hypothetical protein